MSAPESRRALWISRAKLLLVFALFAGPPIVAWLMIQADWRPSGTVNNGVLIQPPQPIEEAKLVCAGGEPFGKADYAGLWTLLVVPAGPCDALCVETLDLVRRVRIALNQDMDRAQIALVQAEGEPAPAVTVPGLRTLRGERAVRESWYGQAEMAAADVMVQVVDPQGFRMMTYAAPLNGKGLLKDLKRLLRVSNEDIERLQRSGEDRR